MRLTPIRNHVIFQFVDEVDSKGQFVKTTSWGFVVPGHFDNSAKMPRWGTVIQVGSDCETIKPGQQILIDALKWTEGFKLDGARFWRTDDKQVIATKNTTNGALKVFRDIVVFERIKDTYQTYSGLQVVGEDPTTTPKGTVIQVGPDVSEEVASGATVYFTDQNFYNEFEHKGKKLWYIEEPNILVYEPA